MDELCLIVQSLIDSEVDDTILDSVYEIHSSIKGIPQEQFQINNKTISINKQTCICPNCGQNNLIATRFAYHLAKCLGAERQSSRQAQRRIIDQIMIIKLTDEDRYHFHKDIENNSILEDGSSCTDSTSSVITSNNSNETHLRLSNEDQDYINDFENDEDWKPKKKKKDLFLVVSSSTLKIDFSDGIIPVNKLCPMTKYVIIPLVPLPISSITSTNNDKIFFKSQQ